MNRRDFFRFGLTAPSALTFPESPPIANTVQETTTVVLECDGKKLAEAVIPHLPEMIKRFNV